MRSVAEPEAIGVDGRAPVSFLSDMLLYWLTWSAKPEEESIMRASGDALNASIVGGSL